MGDKLMDTLYKGPGHPLPVGKDPRELAEENRIPVPIKDVAIATRAHVGRVLLDLPTGLQKPEWDLSDTADPLGIFDYAAPRRKMTDKEIREAGSRSASFMQGVLRSSLELESLLAETNGLNARDFSRFSELVSYVANICYIPKSQPGAKDEKKSDFSIRSYGIQYAPNQDLHGIRTNDIKNVPPDSTHEYVFEVMDHITGRILEIGLFPNRYSNYGPGFRRFSGASLQDAASILSERTTGLGLAKDTLSLRSLDDHPDILDEARKTLKEPSLRVYLLGRDRQIISGMQGDLTDSRGVSGFNLRPHFGPEHRQYSSTRVFMPVGAARPGLLVGLSKGSFRIRN